MVFAALDRVFTNVSVAVGGLPMDQVRLAATLLSVVPLGFAFQFIHKPALRHLIGTALGVLLQYIVYRDLVIWPVLQTIVAYLLIITFKENSGRIVFIENLIFLSAFHIYRQITEYGEWNIDITTVLMMGTPKYVSLAYNVQDGLRYKKDADQPEDERLTEDQILRRLDRIPSFFEFFSYLNFFGGAVCGPSFEFYDFKLFINREKNYAAIPLAACLREVFRLFLRTIFFMALVVVALPKFPITVLAESSYGQQSFFYQLFYFNISILLMRIRYYSGFTLAELGLCSTGLMYNGTNADTGLARWDRTGSANPEKVEFTHDINQKVANWNISIQVWLRKYVYLRLYTEKEIKKSRTKQMIAQYYTLTISAFWHGFYPGYYMAFLNWSICISIAKFFYRWSVNYPKLFEKLEQQLTPTVYKTLRFLSVNIIFNFFGCLFQLFSFRADWNFIVNTGYIYPIIIYIVFAFTLTGKGQRPPKQKTEAPAPSSAVKSEIR